MNPLVNLTLADLYREVRTAERLAVAIPPRPLEDAEMKRAVVASARAGLRIELGRRTALVERMRAFAPRHG